MNNIAENINGVKAAYLGYMDALYFTETGLTHQPNETTEVSLLCQWGCMTDVVAFVSAITKAGLLSDYLEEDGTSWEQLGHDFWFTRNKHGIGFWDRGLGELGDKLTEIAQGFKECYVEEGDDGLLHIL